jgi:hypothetical protein
MEVRHVHDQMGENEHGLIDAQRVDEVGVVAYLFPVGTGGFYVPILMQLHAQQQGGEKRVIEYRSRNGLCQF